MRTVALISGGKDSCFNMMHCVAAGHQLVALANLRPEDKDEMDSYMYQTVGHDAIDFYAEAVGLPLYREYIKGNCIEIDQDYVRNEEDEVEDLYRLLLRVKEAESVEAVAVGAILSNYQRVRVENVCQRLGLTALAYLWRRDQEELLDEMIACRVDAILIKVAALGLDPKKHLGKSIRNLQPELIQLSQQFGLNVCGEGGEYETLTLDCPLFQKRIVIDESEAVTHSKDPFAPVAYLRFQKLHLVEKDVPVDLPLRLSSVPVRHPESFCPELEIVSTKRVPEVGKIEECLENLPQCLKIHDSIPGRMFVCGLACGSVEGFEDLMESVKRLFEERETSMASIVCIGLYVRDMKDYSRVNQIYNRFFDRTPPVRLCVQIPTSDCVVMEILAFPTCDKQSMHVQGISHWAPANIGPYSQAQTIGELTFVAGQIGLIPGSMKLPEPPNFEAECRLALRHTQRILQAASTGSNLSRSIQVFCFLCDVRNAPQAREAFNHLAQCPDLPVVFLEVDGLPRGARVEWQVCSAGSIGEVSCTELNSRSVLVESGSATALTYKLYENMEENVNEIWPRVATYSFVRLFYRSTCQNLSTLSVPRELAVSLIPVRRFEDPDVMAVICALKC